MEASIPKSVLRTKAIPDGVIGMIFLLFTECMFFAGLISALVVNRAGAGNWPPEGQPRLPVEITFLNTCVLLLSALALFFFNQKYKSTKNRIPLFFSIGLGILFLIIQGSEWIRLLGYGLTTKSSLYGAFFYLIIGSHAIHALAGICILLYLSFTLKRNNNSDKIENKITVCSMYWYFVVGIWPVLYWLVYLSK